MLYVRTVSVSNKSLTCHFHFYARQSTKENVCIEPGINSSVIRITFIKEERIIVQLL